MGYYVICTETYEYDGIFIKKGQVDYHNSTQPVFSKRWRDATDKEVQEYKQRIGQLQPNNITDKEYKDLMKVLYPKDNSKKFSR